jgi:hypothetical protein
VPAHTDIYMCIYKHAEMTIFVLGLSCSQKLSIADLTVLFFKIRAQKYPEFIELIKSPIA